MCLYLGIDTSNYTTSVALYSENGEFSHCRKLLPVKENTCGLRQSDAVFHHTQQLYSLYMDLVKNINCKKIKAVGVSSRPRPVEGSYMPCFTVGLNTAKIIAATLGVSLYEFSHQEGHISAAILSSNHKELFNEKFIAFHISGGTTEAVLSTPFDYGFNLEIAAKTLDLNAGQVIDRVGVMLGLSFPCGKQLEWLALNYNGKISIKPTLKDTNCCLSGLENICKKMFDSGDSKEKIAYYCIEYIEAVVCKMTEKLIEKYGKIPFIYAGGVMSNSIIRNTIETNYNGIFANQQLSSDNAVGIAYLAYRKAQNDKL